MSDENLVILEFKYLQNKKWQKQAVKGARIKSYRKYILFSFYSDNLCDVRNEAVFLLLEHSSLRKVKQKTRKKT